MVQSVIELFIYASLKLSKVPVIADKQNRFKKKSYEIMAFILNLIECDGRVSNDTSF